MINNSQYMKIIQYLSILGGGGLEPPCPPVPTPMAVCNIGNYTRNNIYGRGDVPKMVYLHKTGCCAFAHTTWRHLAICSGRAVAPLVSNHHGGVTSRGVLLNHAKRYILSDVRYYTPKCNKRVA